MLKVPLWQISAPVVEVKAAESKAGVAPEVDSCDSEKESPTPSDLQYHHPRKLETASS